MSQRTLSLWTAVKADLKILAYQQDCLAAALKTCHTHAITICDPTCNAPRDTAEQLYSDALQLACDVVQVKMERTVVAVEKNMKLLLDVNNGDDELVVGQMMEILRDVGEVMAVSRKAIAFLELPRNALAEQPVTALLAVLCWFRVDNRDVERAIFSYNTIMGLPQTL